MTNSFPESTPRVVPVSWCVCFNSCLDLRPSNSQRSIENSRRNSSDFNCEILTIEVVKDELGFVNNGSFIQ